MRECIKDNCRRPITRSKLLPNEPGGSCHMPRLSVIGTSSFRMQGPKPRLCPAETPYGVVLSSSKLSLQVDRLSRISHPGYWPVALMPGGPRRTESLLAPFTA
jgi:hypothetical protein